ncbi:MAG: YebC/PmpR family DNA-binding transcriptional regulator [Clostridia bacterium]|nr:YebC/PmpR family DNA-binding transcriptional regulator [Clostridia bacterium]MEE1024314.1 YebC/PmpR family DNA-binding transcriptional regulator [Acutalibacteraceae bacterium]
MSGHSKWNNIKRKKGANDAARAKIFTKIGREMSVIVKQGGPDPNVNSKLKDCIAKAKSLNVPNDNIERIIKKASGDNDTSNYEDCIYEGYGPCGIAVVVECLTDNRNRTAGDIRHYFDKYGGNLGQPGSVMFMFSRRGLIVIDAEGKDEDAVMEAALEAGADDFAANDGAFEIITDPNSVGQVREALEAKGFECASAEAEYYPATFSSIDDDENMQKMMKLLEVLEDNDDVQNVWHNLDNLPEDEEE